VVKSYAVVIASSPVFPKQ